MLFDRIEKIGRRLYGVFRTEKKFAISDVVGRANTPSEYAVKNYSDRCLIRSFLNDVKGLRNSLDFGCGYGRLTMTLKEFCNGRVVGVDINPELVKEARRVYGDSSIEFAILENNRIPYPDNFFDLTITFTVLQHIKNPVPFIHEIKRVTSKYVLAIEKTPPTKFGSPHCWPRKIQEYKRLFHPFQIVKTEKRRDPIQGIIRGSAMLFVSRRPKVNNHN